MRKFAVIRNILFPTAYPPYLIFFVTAKCNMKCRHCFYWKDLNSHANELNLEEIAKFSKTLPNLFFLRITGGEPFLRGDLTQIIKLFYQTSTLRRVSISTNGILTDQTIRVAERLTNELRDLDLEIGISIDNLDDKHDMIRSHPGGFKRALITYDELSKIRERNANLHLGFLITMMKDNEDDLGSIFKFLQTKNPDTIGLNMIRGRPNDLSQLGVDIEKYNKFRGLLNTYNLKGYSRVSFMKRLRLAKTILSQESIIDTIKSPKAHFKCPAGDKIAVLYPDGNVSACELLDSNIGNIRDYEYDFQKLWRSGGREEITRCIEKEKCFCTHECFITAGLIFNLKNILRILVKAAFL